MKKIKFYDLKEEEIPVISNWLSTRNDVEIDYTPGPLDFESAQKLAGYDAVLTGTNADIDDKVYSELEKHGIHVISQRTAGYDYFNLSLAKEHGITITNVPSYSPQTIAEYAVERALFMLRHQDKIRRNVEAHDFRWEPDIRGRVLGEQTVAIVGVGRIGSIAARLFHAFGCQVNGFDILPREDMRGIVNYKNTLEEAIQDADIISIHLPLSDSTRNMFTKETFKQMKQGVLFINSARGGVMVARDLYDAVASHQVEMACIDVYEGEGCLVPFDLRSETIHDELFLDILAHERMFYTPHTAFYTDTAIRNMVEVGLANALECLNTGQAKNAVN